MTTEQAAELSIDATGSALFSALQSLHGHGPKLSVRSLLAFLFVAEHPGARITAIARGCHLDMAGASRAVRALGPADAVWALTPAAGWIDLYLAPSDSRERMAFVSTLGESVLADARARLGSCDSREGGVRPGRWRGLPRSAAVTSESGAR